MTVDSKIVEIIKEYYGDNGLIREIRDLMEKPGDVSDRVEFNAFLLPTHFSVISSSEWQNKFFRLERKELNQEERLSDSVEYIASSYVSQPKVLKREKIKELINFTYFTRSEFAKLFPFEIISLIKDFVILDFKESGRKVNFSIPGEISLNPRFSNQDTGFILHIDCPELQKLRIEYGFEPMSFSIPLGICKSNASLFFNPTRNTNIKEMNLTRKRIIEMD